MAEIAFGRRVPLPGIRGQHGAAALNGHPRATEPQYAASSIAKQLMQRRMEKLQAMIAAQEERDKTEVGVMRVLVDATRQRLLDMRKSRDALHVENAELVRCIEELERDTMRRVSALIEKNVRFGLAAETLHCRGTSDRVAAQSSKHDLVSFTSGELLDLETERAALREDIRQLETELAAVTAFEGEAAEAHARKAAQLRVQISAEERAHAEEETSFLAQVEASCRATLEMTARREHEHASRITQTALEMLPPGMKAMALENVQFRRELQIQHDCAEELREAVAALEDEHRELHAKMRQIEREKQLQQPELKGLPSRRETSTKLMETLRALSAHARA
eukprot:m.243057 g.243057  ORF g.243057 m.243057 type:complete len:337 (+) comp14158_c0_seq1:123-1133(+)